MLIPTRRDGLGADTPLLTTVAPATALTLRTTEITVQAANPNRPLTSIEQDQIAKTYAAIDAIVKARPVKSAQDVTFWRRWADKQKLGVKNGTLPFARTTRTYANGLKVTYSKHLVPTVPNTYVTRRFVKPPPPPPDDPWYADAWNAVTDAVSDAGEWLYDQIGDIVGGIKDGFVYLVKQGAWAAIKPILEQVCSTLQNPNVATVLVVAATLDKFGVWTLLGVPPGIISNAQLVLKVLTALCAAYAGYKLATMEVPAPPPGGLSPGVPTELVKLIPGTVPNPPPPAPPAPRYPKGSFARFNTSRQVWVIYAPVQVMAGLGMVDASVPLDGAVVPAVPEGFVAVAEEQGQPGDVPAAGEERDAAWYDNKLIWAGAGLALVGGALVVRSRRAARAA